MSSGNERTPILDPTSFVLISDLSDEAKRNPVSSAIEAPESLKRDEAVSKWASCMRRERDERCSSKELCLDIEVDGPKSVTKW